MELAFNPLGLTHEHGSRKLRTKLLYLISAFLLLNSYTTIASNQLFFTGENNDYPFYLKFKIDEAPAATTINWTIKSKEFNEKNTTVVKNKTLIYSSQTSMNNIDNEHFEWVVSLNKDHYEIFFKNTKYNEIFQTKLKKTKSITTIQGLLYNMKYKQLSINQTFNKNLLIPWKTIVPIKISVTKKETLTVNKQPIPTFKIIVEINSLFGKFLPKSTLWVTESYPHNLIKQKNFKQYYERIKTENLSNDIRSLFNE